MRRRDFITLVGGAAAAPSLWPLAGRAQQPGMPVVGVLGSPTAEAYASFMAAFRQGLGETGFVEGRNVAIEYRWAEDHYDRLPILAADLVGKRVSVIAALGNQQSPRAAKAATATIPIVFAIGADPLSGGLITSFSRPGGNMTGATQLAGPLNAKRLQLIVDLVPGVKVLGLLVNPGNPPETVADVDDAVRSLGRRLEVASAGSESEFDAAFASLVQRGVGALSVVPDTLFTSRAQQLAAIAARYHVPAIYSSAIYVKAGGLMSYGSDPTESYHQAGVYVGRILKGEKPGDLPVIQPTKFELAINLKAAGALGLSVSRDMQLIADEVIE
jgi:putative ABC transport system substrate-binding protein